MGIEFEASRVSIIREPWGLIVELVADDALDESEYLTFQAKDEFTEQDVRFGMNDVYVECCDQGWPWYGQVVSATLSCDSLRVQLSAEAGAHMGNDGMIEVKLALGSEEFGELKRAIGHVFRSHSGYVTPV